MRRLFWNLYALPIMLFLILVLLDEIGEGDSGLLPIVDLAMSLPCVVALHLHIWDKRFLTAAFWKPYAFGFLLWEIVYNLILQPKVSGEPFDPIILLVPILLLPLYTALFRYGYREWNDDREQNHPWDGTG